MTNRVYRVPVSFGANLFAEEILPDRPAAAGAPTVVLAHGWCLDHTSWHKVIADLRRRRDVRIVVFDLRGHGKSTMGVVDEPSVRILGDDFYEVIDMAAPDGPLVLGGHSMGGMSIMSYAGLHHDHFSARVRGTVLASTASSIEGRTPVPLESLIMGIASRAPGIPPRLLVPRIVQGRLLFGENADPNDIKHCIHQIKNTKMPTIGRFFNAISKHNEAEALAHFVDVPTHIITGSEDRLIPVPHAQALRQRIPAADLHVVPDAGHMTIYEAAEFITDTIVSLLDSAPPARRSASRRSAR
ncbi:MAG: alpha/beta hydrolase [Candidatus Phosphoribacter sp.]|nr:alpha/beta hydrolase [Actinomycetales bacterium]